MKSLSRIRKRTGRCYELAVKVMLDEPESHRFKLAHGSVSMVPNSTRSDCFMDHAWIILDDRRIYDPVLNMYMARVRFNVVYRATEERFYSRSEVAEHLVDYIHCGPWH